MFIIFCNIFSYSICPNPRIIGFFDMFYVYYGTVFMTDYYNIEMGFLFTAETVDIAVCSVNNKILLAIVNRFVRRH